MAAVRDAHFGINILQYKITKSFRIKIKCLSYYTISLDGTMDVLTYLSVKQVMKER